MDLSTRYLGFELEHPVVLGASPLVDDLDAVRRAEDAGVAAIVMHSLFEEQIDVEQRFMDRHVREHAESSAEARYYLPDRAEFALDPHQYLEQIRRIKTAVRVPVIASLNGTGAGGWLEYATLMDQAGADAIELNVYRVETDLDKTSELVEEEMLEIVRGVRLRTALPLAVKLSPFLTALPSFAKRLVGAGANGIVLFNRFYQPDIDLDALEVRSQIELSSSAELLLRLRWLAILSSRVEASFAVSGGVHTPLDALKAVSAGAHAVQVVSEVLKHGVYRIRELRRGMAEWLELKGYESLSQLSGSMGLARCPSPAMYERVNYLHVLNSWQRRLPDEP